MNSHEPSPPPTAPSACPGCESLRQRLDEAIAERDQTIAGLQVAINEMHIRAVDAEAGFPCVNERDTTITSLRDSLVAANAHAAKLEREAHKDRASIVAFLAAEAGRFDRSARSASGDFVYDKRALEISCDKLRAQADIIRSLAAQIARGDDRQGGE